VGGDAREEERRQREEDAVEPVVVAEMNGVEGGLAAERRLDLLGDEGIADTGASLT
jgi:hypothetical protein